MVAARMVSKTWYAFIENQRGIWINLMRKCFEDIPKKAHKIAVDTGCYVGIRPGQYLKSDITFTV
jgi:hypothetical protein